MVSAMSSRPPSPQASAGPLLRRWRLWLIPSILSAVVAFGVSMLYMGGILNPNGNLHQLPIALVDADNGRPAPGQQQNLGAQLTSAIVSAPATRKQVQWRQVDLAEAKRQLASGRVYGALVIPQDFSSDVASLSTANATSRPTLTVLTNPGMGSLGSSLASQITQTAAHQASTTIGAKLVAAEEAKAPKYRASATTRLLLSDPVAVAVAVGHPIGPRTGLSLSAFYLTLLVVLTGFIGGNIISGGVDTGLGYADSELGPWHSRRPTVPISRTQTLVLKMTMSAGIAVLTTTLVIVATVVILGMDAPHLALLCVFCYCATLTVGLGVQAINAAFGGIGQLVSMFIFIALAVPSSGATIPLEATPPFYRFLAYFEPMRQLAAGMRSILFFDARADAGLARGWAMIALGFVVAMVFGFGMTHYYDRRGLRRLTPQPSLD